MLYLETLESNEPFRTNKFSPRDENILRDSWEQLTKSLNSSGGPQRSTNAWKRIFSDWKSAVRKRARAIKVGEKKTGGGPPEKPLNDLEQKLIDLSGVVVIDGFAGVPELGLLMNVSPVNTTLEASNDKLSIDQTDNVQPGSCNRTNPAVSKMWTGSEHGSLPPKKDLKKPVKKRSTFVSSVQNYLKNHVDTDYTPILGDINHNLKELVATEQQNSN
ncbi:hypothetical protein JTB14_038402 [Gonioctena quinquepunctata]|nr:hypothetical protein JTB14_038402 [Gonioctena quinquepunctata]